MYVLTAVIIYLLIGFFFVKPEDLRNIHYNYVDFSSGFFMYAMPLWAWILMLILWPIWVTMFMIRKII
jgi:hypothetical protein